VSEADVNGPAGFEPAPEADAPTPVSAEEELANCAGPDASIPDVLFPEEHVAELGDYTVVRAGVKCPSCGGCLFYHPKSIRPRNTVSCFQCQWAGYSVAWWEDTRLSSYGDDVDGDE